MTFHDILRFCEHPGGFLQGAFGFLLECVSFIINKFRLAESFFMQKNNYCAHTHTVSWHDIESHGLRHSLPITEKPGNNTCTISALGGLGKVPYTMHKPKGPWRSTPRTQTVSRSLKLSLYNVGPPG